MKISKLFPLLVLILSVTPLVLAEETPPEEESCSIFSLVQCLKDTAYLISYTLGLAAQPFIQLIQYLMTEPPNTEVFKTAWLSIISIISIFYIFFLLYSGITFITQGDNIVKRYKAKESIKNMVIAIILVSSSFYLYNILIDLNSSLTSYIFANINPDFFTVTSDSFGNVLLQILLILPYVIVLLLTSILLMARYIFVSFGVIFFPIGIFLYFVPFLKSYGKLIINISLLLIFIPFITSIIIYGSSLLVTAPIFENFTILFYIVAFLIVDFSFYLLIKFVLNKSGAGEIANIGESIAAIGKFI